MRIIYLLVIVFGFGVLSANAGDNTSIDNERRLGSFCNTCHGNDGFSVGKTIPTIKGQNKQFLINSMEEFKAGKRHLTLMGKIATGYTSEEIILISNKFSVMKWGSSNTEKLDSKSIAQGKKLATDCVTCHNKDSENYVPKIEGQHATYLYKALMEYKSKLRNNDAHASEMDAVVDMKDADLKALADYFASLK